MDEEPQGEAGNEREGEDEEEEEAGAHEQAGDNADGGGATIAEDEEGSTPTTVVRLPHTIAWMISPDLVVIEPAHAKKLSKALPTQYKDWTFLDSSKIPITVGINQNSTLVTNAKAEYEAVVSNLLQMYQEIYSEKKLETTEDLKSLTNRELLLPFISPFWDKVLKISTQKNGGQQPFTLDALKRYVITRANMAYYQTRC